MTAAWTAPRTWTNGETVTETEQNTHVRDNLEYLKGVLDGTNLQDFLANAAKKVGVGTDFHMSVSGNSRIITFASGDTITYDVSANTFDVKIGATSMLQLDATFSGHRHPYGGNRHIESGVSAAEVVADHAANDDAFSFTNAFSATPVVTVGLSTDYSETGYVQGSMWCQIVALNTTGVTLRKAPSGMGTPTMTSSYIAEGAD